MPTWLNDCQGHETRFLLSEVQRFALSWARTWLHSLIITVTQRCRRLAFPFHLLVPVPSSIGFQENLTLGIVVLFLFYFASVVLPLAVESVAGSPRE
jgi:hypothetical protein